MPRVATSTLVQTRPARTRTTTQTLTQEREVSAKHPTYPEGQASSPLTQALLACVETRRP